MNGTAAVRTFVTMVRNNKTTINILLEGRFFRNNRTAINILEQRLATRTEERFLDNGQK